MNETLNKLGEAAAVIVARGAQLYLQQHSLTADHAALAACCKSWAKIKLPEAMRDAREAFACNMIDIGVRTFTASMMQAGIEAAKEASYAPRPVVEFNEADCGGVFDGFSVTSDADPGM